MQEIKKFLLINIEWLITSMVSFLTPLNPFMYAVGVLIVLDSFTGYWAAAKRGEITSSRKLGAGLFAKLVLYPIIVLVGALCEFLWPTVPFLRCALAMIAVVEFKSIILENVKDITGISLKNELKSFFLNNKDQINKF